MNTALIACLIIWVVLTRLIIVGLISNHIYTTENKPDPKVTELSFLTFFFLEAGIVGILAIGLVLASMWIVKKILYVVGFFVNRTLAIIHGDLSKEK
tara:strand:+ start:748 stop:1038 length:291 start_codon:yes stop_codon:yes gene_type:complete